MQPRDQKAFVQLLTDALAYYRQDCSEFTISVWWQACQTYTLEQVTKAMTAHATDPERGVFAPKVADIVRQLSGTHTDRAMLAWGKTHEAMGSVGAYTDVVFDDPAIHAVIDDLGGWPKICRTEIKELGYLQHRFCEGHKAYVGRGTFDYPRKLMGDRSSDDIYAKRGLPPPTPALVGNVDAALMVYRQGGQGGKTQISFSVGQAIQATALGYDARGAA